MAHPFRKIINDVIVNARRLITGKLLLCSPRLSAGPYRTPPICIFREMINEVPVIVDAGAGARMQRSHGTSRWQPEHGQRPPKTRQGGSGMGFAAH